MKKILMALICALLSVTMTATATPTVTLEAFASNGPAVTEATMTNQTVYVSSTTALSMSGVNFGLRVIAKEGESPINGTLSISSVSYQRHNNSVLKASASFSKYNLSGDGSRPDMAVKDVGGTVLSPPATAGLNVAGSSFANANRFVLEDFALAYNPVNFPALSSPGDNVTVTFTATGTFDGTPFTTTTASASVIVMDVPSAPAGLELSGGEDKTLTWTDGPNESGYIAEWSSDGSVWTSIGSVGAGVTTLNVPWFKSCEARQFRVSATNLAGTSAPSVVIEMPGISSVSMVEGHLVVGIVFISGIDTGNQIEVSTDLVNWGPPPVGTGFSYAPHLLTVTLPSMENERYFMRVRSGPAMTET